MAISSLEYINVAIMDRRSKLNDLKICQLCAVDFSVSKFLTPLIDGMKKNKWDVDIICSKGKYSEDLIKAGYNFKFVKIERSFSLFKLLYSIFNVYKIFIKERYDIVHVHSPLASIIGRIASKLAGIPFVVYTAHGFYFHDDMPKLKYLFYFMIEKFLGNLTDLIFTQSLEDYNTAIKSKFLTKKKIYFIGNGVSLKKFNPNVKQSILDGYKEKLNIPKDGFVIGTISRLVKEKGLVEFLKAAQLILNVYPNTFFLLIGERLPSDYDDSISKELNFAKNNMTKNLKLLGDRSDIRELIAIMDLFCLPSWREGMPRTVIEAMMMKKPVIGTNIRGSRELIIHKKTGLIVPVKKEKELEKGMKFFIENKNKCKMYGACGRQRAEKLFNEDKIVLKQIKLISKIFKEKK